ncbi:MAG: hypothetical protein QM662_14425 [Gordonia sp. (in: high G+C Gram-positive bacteria)]
MSWRGVLIERKGGPLPPARAAARLAAYLYGNILVLASVVVASAHSIIDGTAALLVLGTGVTTYAAHVFAELIAHGNIPEAHGAGDSAGLRRILGDELRDAVPIASSAIGPALVLGLGYHALIPTQAAHLVAGAVVVVRIASVPLVTERVRGNAVGPRVLVAGLLTAALAALIVLLKTFLGH